MSSLGLADGRRAPRVPYRLIFYSFFVEHHVSSLTGAVKE
jgi:hypothetical protein